VATSPTDPLSAQMEQLRASEERFRGAFDHTNVAMVLTDMSHRFLRANAAFARLFGYSEEEILRLSMPEITHPDDLADSLDAAPCRQRHRHRREWCVSHHRYAARPRRV